MYALDDEVPNKEDLALEALVNKRLAKWAFSILAFIEPYVDCIYVTAVSHLKECSTESDM